MTAVFRFLVINEDGERVGRYETSQPYWRAGDVFDIDGQTWRIVEVLPEVSTMVAYNAVWVATAVDDEIDEAPVSPRRRGVRRTPREPPAEPSSNWWPRWASSPAQSLRAR